MAYQYCSGCNTRYVDTGCAQDLEHENCPRPCAMCGLLLDGRSTDQSCPGHDIAEARAFYAMLRHRR